MAGLSTGVAVDNQYGVAFHSTVLAGLGVAEDDIAAMRAGSAPTDVRQAAVYEFARECVTNRGTVGDATLDRLTATGATTAEILDIVAECVFASLVGHGGQPGRPGRPGPVPPAAGLEPGPGNDLVARPDPPTRRSVRRSTRG